MTQTLALSTLSPWRYLQIRPINEQHMPSLVVERITGTMVASCGDCFHPMTLTPGSRPSSKFPPFLADTSQDHGVGGRGDTTRPVEG